MKLFFVNIFLHNGTKDGSGYLKLVTHHYEERTAEV